jgi:hypothetical protein
MGAPAGNKNSSKANRLWGDTIRRALAQDKDPDKLRSLAEALIARAADGDLGALKEIGDRLDGKVAQQVYLSGGPDGTPVDVDVVTRIEIVAPHGFGQD